MFRTDLSWHRSLRINLFAIDDMGSCAHACIHHVSFRVRYKPKTSRPGKNYDIVHITKKLS